MQPTEYIRDVAAVEVKRIRGLIGEGFRGAKCPLPVPGWFVHLDGKGEARELTYEKDGIVARYNA